MAPVSYRLGNRGRTLKGENEKSRVSTSTNVLIENITATGCRKTHGASITGIPGHYVEHITLRNLNLEFSGGNTNPKTVYQVVPENVRAYPKPDLFDKMDLPAYGIYARQVKNLILDHVKIRYVNEDVRPGLIFDDCEDYRLSHVDAKSNAATMPAVFWHVQDGAVRTRSRSNHESP